LHDGVCGGVAVLEPGRHARVELQVDDQGDAVAVDAAQLVVVQCLLLGARVRGGQRQRQQQRAGE
jgi:hypothetical protein